MIYYHKSLDDAGSCGLNHEETSHWGLFRWMRLLKPLNKMKNPLQISVIIATLGMIVGSAGATVLTTTTIADTRIGGSLTQQTINNGGAAQMLVGTHATLGKLHGLLRFDLSTLPEDVVISSVTLKMTKPQDGVGTAFTVNVFELTAANADWVQGTANNVSQTGSATWNIKGGTSAWAGSAGASTAGTDYINTSLATYGGSLLAGNADFISSAAFLTAVHDNRGGFLNLGLGLNSGATASYYRFATLEGEVSKYAAASLVIDYTVIPEPATVGLLGAGLLVVIVMARRRKLA